MFLIYVWERTCYYCLWCLKYFIWHNDLQLHPHVVSDEISPYSISNTYILCESHIHYLFIGGGQLGYFHFLVIVSSVSIHLWIQISLKQMILISIWNAHSNGTAESYDRFFFSFWESSNCFPLWLYKFTIPSAAHWDSLFSYF